MVAATVLAFLVGILPAETARADFDLDYNYGARLTLGGGSDIASGKTRGIFELAPRVEMLFGKSDEQKIMGPAIEFRTVTFQTAELTGGLTGAIPYNSSKGRGLLLSIGGGYAWRKDEPNGAILTSSVAWGLLGCTGCSEMFFSTTLYLSFRHAMTGPSREELTAGVSLGGGLTMAMVAPFGR